MRLFVFTVSLMAISWLPDPSAAQQDLYSANYNIEACRADSKRPPFFKGVCAGQIQTLLALNYLKIIDDRSKSCPPMNVSIEQAQRVVVKFIDARPEKMHEAFLLLAMDALAAAWPCK